MLLIVLLDIKKHWKKTTSFKTGVAENVTFRKE
jgi:hypothetical protein